MHNFCSKNFGCFLCIVLELFKHLEGFFHFNISIIDSLWLIILDQIWKITWESWSNIIEHWSFIFKILGKSLNIPNMLNVLLDLGQQYFSKIRVFLIDLSIYFGNLQIWFCFNLQVLHSLDKVLNLTSLFRSFKNITCIKEILWRGTLLYRKLLLTFFENLRVVFLDEFFLLVDSFIMIRWWICLKLDGSFNIFQCKNQFIKAQIDFVHFVVRGSNHIFNELK